MCRYLAGARLSHTVQRALPLPNSTGRGRGSLGGLVQRLEECVEGTHNYRGATSQQQCGTSSFSAAKYSTWVGGIFTLAIPYQSVW